MKIEVAYPVTWMTRRFFQIELNLGEYQVDLGILCSQSIEHCALGYNCPSCTIWKIQVLVVYWLLSHLKIITLLSYSVILMKKTTMKTTTLEELREGHIAALRRNRPSFCFATRWLPLAFPLYRKPKDSGRSWHSHCQGNNSGMF